MLTAIIFHNNVLKYDNYMIFNISYCCMTGIGVSCLIRRLIKGHKMAGDSAIRKQLKKQKP